MGPMYIVTPCIYKKSFGASHIVYSWWSTLAENRDARRLTTNHVVSSFEKQPRAALKAQEEEPDAIKSRADLQLRPLPFQLGLISHERACIWCRLPPSWCTFTEVKLYIYMGKQEKIRQYVQIWKNRRSSEDDYIYGLNYLPTLTVSVF